MSQIFYGVATPNLVARLSGGPITYPSAEEAFKARRDAARADSPDTLTQTELMVVRNMGITVEQFVAAKKARRARFLGASRPADDADEVRSKVYYLMGLNPDGTCIR